MLTHNTIALPGYSITEKLYAGSRTLVYRAIREADFQPVVIKFLKNEHPSFSELVQFRNQYTIAKNLDIPGIIKPYSLEPHGNGYALVMEDFGGNSLRHFADGRSLPLEQFMAIALQLIDILHPLHQQRVIHKDIKPANILIQSETQQVKLIDFSISSLLLRETQEIKPPHGLEGTLAYLSPEQTGRMNRGIDYRSDFYALGVTFYELLTGRLPFQSNDPMEMVHCHIAEQPPSVCTLNPEIPLMLGEMVGKLMAKNAEDRYQSALGLKHDLICLTQRQTTDDLSGFELGQRDLCDRFLIPEKLYGREVEVRTLLEAFDRIANGTSELILVAGFSGIGKTAVVNEVHKPIVRQRGYFIKGKFDQFNRNIPFSAFVQAFRDLMGQLLLESDTQLNNWRTQTLNALSDSAQVIIDVIPELEQIIGAQPAVSELSGTAAQNRFNLLFQKFIQVCTTPEHPLVMFLDDLQWADSASLNLMQLLMNESKSGYLLLIGAYRDNEVSPAHPLMLTLDEIYKAKATANTITLQPLSQSSLNQLVSDTLNCRLGFAAPLTNLVYQKTKGNPFFATQFLKVLHQEGLVTFDLQAGLWHCDIVQVREAALTDDVVELMATQLKKLPEATQTALKLAACIGNQFDLNTLAIVSEQLEINTAEALWKALQEGLILPQSEVYKFYLGAHDTTQVTNHQSLNYKFLHDRVQQAAYSLIPDDQKQITHLQIGRLLQQATDKSEQDQLLFAIVNHLNKGASLVEDEQEQQELVRLNLAAGQKAKSATAYTAALNYFNTGISLLRGDTWQHQYDLTLALYEGAADSAYLSTDFEQMEQLAAVVLKQAHSWLDRVNISKAKIQACAAQNQPLKALGVAREVLEHLGVSLPEQPTPMEIEQSLQQIQALLDNRAIESLLELPEMTAPEKQAAIVILSSITSVAYQAAPALLSLIIFAQVDLSVKYGNAPESAVGYSQYGLMLIAILGDVEAGYHFGQLGINLLQRLNASPSAAKTIFGFNVFLRHWKEPAKASLDGYLQAYTHGLETGDLEHVALSLMCYDYTAYFSGQELSDLKQTIEDHRNIIQQFRQNASFRIQSIYYQAVLNLLETRAEPDRLSSEHYDEDEMIQLHLEANQLLILFQIYFNKLILAYLFQRYKQALENALLSEQYLGAAAGLLHVPLFSFYDALVQLAVYSTASETEQTRILDRVTAHQEKLSQWAAYAPSNQAHRCDLVAAERCRVLGQKAEAIDLYDRAIVRAQENEYIQEEAIANELAAKFYLEWGKERVAQEYLINAYYGYARWGAKAKIVDLETRYPQLLAPILQQSHSPLSVNETVLASARDTSTTFGSISDALDLAAILKASQTLSSEIELGKLLSTLLQLVIENAGADKCVLMLVRDDRLFVKGLATFGAEPVVLQRIPVEESQDIPLKLIYGVKNRLEPIVLMDATDDSEFVSDPYFLRQQPKSILCSPILHQGKLLGIVYLENKLTIGAFTRDRVHILNLLCAQATISLENARLYQQSQDHAQALEQSLEQIQKSETQLRQLFESSADAILLLDNGVFTDCNLAAIEMMRCSNKEQFLSLHPSQLSPEMQPDGRSSFEKANAMIATALQKGTHRFEWMHCRSDGEDFWAEVVLTAMPYKDRNILHTVWREIGDRKRSEKALKLTQFAIDHASLSAWWVKSNGQLLYANDSACRDLGYSQAEILDRYIWDINPKFSSATWEEHRQNTKDKGSLTFESLNINKSGDIYPVEVTVNYVELDGEEYHFAFVQNIHDRKQAEQQLQESKQLLQLVLNTIPHKVFWKDCDLVYQGSNRAFAEAVGFSSSTEIVDKSDYDLSWTTEESDWFRKCDRRVIESNMPELGIVETTLQADGTTVWIETSKLPLHSVTGTVIGILGIYQDITDRKQAEQRLQESQQLLQLVIDNIPQLVCWKNRDSIYLGCNAIAAKLWGLESSADLVGKTNYDFSFTPEEAAWYQECDRRVMDSGQPEFHIIETQQQADGRQAWLDTNKIPLHDSDGNVVGLLVTIEDITDRKATDLAIQQKTEALEHTLQELQQAQLQIIQSEKMSALGNLVAGVAHEINNPLGFIAGNLQPALDHIKDTFGLIDLYQQEYPHPSAAIQDEIEAIDLDYVRQDLLKLIGSMKLGVERIRGISTSLRVFSRADQDHKVGFNIHEGIDSTILILKHRLKANSDRPAIEINTDYGNIPIIECFPGQLNQVFMNILANAIDTLEELNQKRTVGSIVANPARIEIRTCLDDSKKQISIYVRDNGMGMSDKVKQQVFDHSFTTKAVGKGTGLGLAIARQIIEEKHSGAIEVNSTLGVGTAFIITLPVKTHDLG